MEKELRRVGIRPRGAIDEHPLTSTMPLLVAVLCFFLVILMFVFLWLDNCTNSSEENGLQVDGELESSA
jgi:hypothetical protein